MTTTHYDPEHARPELPPPGHYDATATSWTWERSKAGEVYLALLLAFEHEGRSYTARGALFFGENPDKLGRTPWEKSLDALHAMGLSGDDLDVIGENVGPIGEGTVDIELEHEVYQDRETGEDRTALKARWINPPRKARTLTARNAPDAGTLGGFFAQMKAKSRALSARAQASGTRPAAQQAQQPQQPRQSAPAQRAANANARPMAQPQPQHQQRAQQPAQRQPPPRMPQTGSQDFGSDDEIPF